MADVWALPETVYPTRSVTYTGTAGTTGSWPTGPGGQPPNMVRVLCTSDAYVAVGENVTATTESIIVAANRPVTIGIPSPGQTFVVSAIQVSTGGTLYATPIGGT